MKKIFLILFSLIALTSFSQEHTNQNQTNINVGQQSIMAKGMDALQEQKKSEGMFYSGNGEFVVTQVGNSGFVSLKKLEQRCNEQIQEYCERNNYTYEVKNIQRFKQGVGVFPKVQLDVIVKDKNGVRVENEEDEKIRKENLRKEILSLKEYLDMGVITQEEYDQKINELKKLILQ